MGEIRTRKDQEKREEKLGKGKWKSGEKKEGRQK